jgi:hypothetical protein
VLFVESNVVTPADQGLFPHEQPTNNMRTATVKRIVQRREVISYARRFSILRPDPYMRGGECPETGRHLAFLYTRKIRRQFLPPWILAPSRLFSQNRLHANNPVA